MFAGRPIAQIVDVQFERSATLTALHHTLAERSPTDLGKEREDIDSHRTNVQRPTPNVQRSENPVGETPGRARVIPGSAERRPTRGERFGRARDSVEPHRASSQARRSLALPKSSAPRSVALPAALPNVPITRGSRVWRAHHDATQHWIRARESPGSSGHCDQ